MDYHLCKRCGYSIGQDEAGDEAPKCPTCNVALKLEPAFVKPGYALAEPVEQERLTSEPTRLSLSFTGNAGEYFRIWIVNTLLTIVTLGFYAPWAKVRNRNYFYRNTILDGHHFDYTANPVALLKGYLIIAFWFVLYMLTSQFYPLWSGLVVLAFYIILPYLIYKSIRFFTHNSTYRNIRFKFSGKVAQSYTTYLLVPMLLPFTLGLIIPYWAFKKKEYFYRNISFGTQQNEFNAVPARFYRAYIVAFFVYVVAFIVAGAFMILSFSTIKTSQSVGSMIAFAISMMGLYLLFIAAAVFVQQYLYAWQTNYCFGHSTLGNIRVRSTLEGRKLFWIRFTNIFAIILSVGLLAPWAKVRRMKYIISNIVVIARQDLGEFTASSEPEDSAIGDAATDFMDFEIGL
ncbi:MAG: DUF898 family protein [Thermodesulfovibrionales bacterium]|nr:DUF898 family protein [Thermodesulfovibrionales bacterium]